MQIEAGKFYQTRDGRKVGPVDYNPEYKGDRHPFVSSCRYWRYTADGCLFTDSTSRGDLIAEWVDEPTGQTLAELDVKPGDVVRYDNLEYEVMHPDGHPWLNVSRIWGKRGSRDNWIDETCPACTIVSRANEPTEDKPKTWGEMTDAEKGALLLARLNGGTVEGFFETDTSVVKRWFVWCRDDYMDRIPYRIRKEPLRETVTLSIREANSKHGDWYTPGTPGSPPTHTITFDTIDGKPDCASITMAKLDEVR